MKEHEILNNFPARCMVCDEEHTIIFANRALSTARKGDPIGKKCFVYMHDRDSACPNCPKDRAMNGEVVVREVFNELDQRWYHATCTAIDLDEGRRGYLCVATDITQQKMEEEKAERYARFLESIIQNAPIMIFGNKGGLITLFNKECERVTGYEAKEVLGKSLFDLFVIPEEEERVRGHCKLVHQGRYEPGFEFTWRTKDGKLKRTVWNCMLIEDPQGEPLVFGMGLDVTEHRRLEQQFLQAQKMETVGRMAGGLAHDINNFLTAVKTSAELALMTLDNRASVEKNLGRILSATERTSDLARRLLTFSRKEIIQPEPLDLNHVVKGLLDMLKKLMGEDIQIEILLLDHTPTVIADKGQLEQILVNLAVNARDAMPKGGLFCVELGEAEITEPEFSEKIGVAPGHYYTISVSDSGSGMDPRIIPFIFDPFFTTKPKGKGTGLGLSTVYSIVKQNGGHVSVYSEEGKGTTFKIYWPKAEAPQKKISAPYGVEQETPFDHGPKATILVVEDDQMILDSVADILEGLGYTILKARSAQEAIEASNMHTGKIDLLFTDVVMPGLNGRELYQLLKKERPGIKVLFTSGYTENSIARHGVLEKGLLFLQKPYEIPQLQKRLKEILG